LEVLADHYKVPRERPDLLVLCLAFAHVPGFQVVSENRGRKKSWEVKRLLRLATTVERVRAKNGGTDRAACKFIASDNIYAREWGRPGSHRGSQAGWIETLESRLQEGKRHNRLVLARLPSMKSNIPKIQ
jgi:hypothetical protein